MGLGKTFQVITFLHTVAVNIPAHNQELRRMLVLGPVNTLQNWKAELERWIPDGGRLPYNKLMSVFILDEAGRTNKLRCEALQRWFKEGGVMCMGYEMYRNLTQGTRVSDKKVKNDLHRFLRDPGPGILIADEGHLLRNHKSNVSKAVAAVRTKRRVVLTGSPLQNNLTEYHCMIDFINHGFLGSLNEFRNQFEIPIMNGEAKDAAAADVKRMKWRNHVLTKKLEPMIQRKDFTPLVQSLPPKYEFTLKIRLTAIQKRLYKHAIDNREECGMFSVLKAFHTLLKIWNHPFVLCQTAKGDDTSLVSQDLGGLSHSHGLGSIGGSMRGDVPLLEEEEDSDCQVLGEDTFPKQHGAAGAHAMGNGGASHGSAQYNPMWFRRILEEEHVSPEKLCDVECSGKLLVLWKLLHEADEQNEKVLVFSQSLAMLDVIEQVLKKNPVGSSCWKPGHDYYRLDGSKSSKQRQGDIDNFNDIANTRARLFLISTRAGSLGVNMVAANRVVLFDCNFNPSYDLQAIFRTYRYGQTRPCFVYRLVSWGTMEEKIYKRQINKQSRAARAVDSWQVERHYKKEDLMLDQQLLALEEDEEVLKVDSDDDDESVDEGMVGHSDVKKAMKSDTILRAMVDKTFVSTARNKHHKMDRYDKLRRSLIRAVSLDESLVCDKEAEQLSREEQAAATEDYEMAQKADRAAPTVAAKAKPCPRCNQPLTIKPTQEKFGCPSCKGIFRASSSACIGELVTDPATGATVPRLFPESDPSRPGGGGTNLQHASHAPPGGAHSYAGGMPSAAAGLSAFGAPSHSMPGHPHHYAPPDYRGGANRPDSMGWPQASRSQSQRINCVKCTHEMIVGEEASRCASCGTPNQLCRCTGCNRMTILEAGVRCKCPHCHAQLDPIPAARPGGDQMAPGMPGMRAPMGMRQAQFDGGRGGNPPGRFQHQVMPSMGTVGNFGQMRGDNLQMTSAQSSAVRSSQGGMEGLGGSAGGGNGIYSSAGMQAADGRGLSDRSSIDGRGLLPLDELGGYPRGGWSSFQSLAPGPEMHAAQPFGGSGADHGAGSEIDDLLFTNPGAGAGGIEADLGINLI